MQIVLHAHLHACIWGSHSGNYEECYLNECDAVQSGTNPLMFPSIVLPLGQIYIK
jgi:hypothetical protein